MNREEQFFRSAVDPARNHLFDEWERERGATWLLDSIPTDWDYRPMARRAYWEAMKHCAIVLTFIVLIQLICGRL